MARLTLGQPLKMVAVRLPQALIDEAQRYADLYHSSVSTLLREGLELRLHPTEGVPASDGQTGLPPGVVAMLTQLARTLTTTAAEVGALCQRGTEGETSNRITAKTDEVSNGITRQAAPPPAPTLAPDDHEPSATRSSLDAATSEPEGFDTTKFYLGKLCKYGHDYRGTGKSLLRRNKGDCRRCMTSSVRRARKRETGV